MTFSDKNKQVGFFSQIYKDEDFVFSETFYPFSITLFDLILKKNLLSDPISNQSHYTNNFFEKIFKKVRRIIYVLVFLWVLAQTLFRGSLPGKAQAMQAPQPRVAIGTSIVPISPREQVLHVRDDFYRQSPCVVVPALQPRFHGRGIRGPVTTRAALVAQPAKYSLQTQSVVLNSAQLNMAQFVNNNNLITLATLQTNQIIITKKDLILNESFTKAQNVFVHQQVENLAKILTQESRIAGVKKVLNFQDWEIVDGIPTLTFNADGSFGPYSQNKLTSSTIKKVLGQFLEQNKEVFKLFFEDENGFSFIYRPAQAEHTNQKTQLEGLLLSKDESNTYLIDETAHTIKTSNIDLCKPASIDSVTNWFRFNGERTIDFLRTLWDDGLMTDSVESFEVFEIAIRECVEADIVTFKEKGLPDEAVDFAGQIKATSIGSKDLDRLGEAFANTSPEHLNESKCIDLLGQVIQKSQLRAAYIHEGLHQFPFDSIAHRSQDYQSLKFMSNLDLLIETATSQIPSLLTNGSFIEDYDRFLEILNGNDAFQEIVTSEEYAEFKRSLNNPKSQVNLLARNFNINKYKTL